MKTENSTQSVSVEISPEHFKTVQMRCGTIISAETPKNARKPAYILEIDFGPFGIRKSSAQITKRYTAENLIGQQVIAVFNLPARQIGNIQSQCLVLGVECDEGDVVLLKPEARVPNGKIIS